MIFIDLENTVIESWDNMIPMERNMNAIKEYLSQCKDEVGVFSFAIWDQHDAITFMQKLSTMVSNGIGKKFSFIMCMADLKRRLSNEFHLDVIDEDFTTFLSKEYAFEKYVKSLVENGCTDTNFVLIDDVVPERTVFMDVKGKTIQCMTVNVENVVKIFDKREK